MNPWEKSIPITWLNFLASSNVDRPTAQPISRAMLGTSSCWKFKRQKSLLPQAYHSTHVRESGFWNPWLFACRIRKFSGKFLLVVSRILGFGIWNTVQGIWNPTYEWYLEFSRPGIRNSWLVIQNPRLSRFWIPLHAIFMRP